MCSISSAKGLVVSARSCDRGLWEREERRVAQGRSVLAGNADNVEVEIACPRYRMRAALTLAQRTRCDGIAGGPPTEETYGKSKGKVREVREDGDGAAC